ncbi:lipase family protein [Almyronema epifaneia]|uniref:Lipase family protein n=1 Tax=Almyronema epifaneia S1 TaxID=2991925 RepID=A0ABW6IIN7_9CYAN
MVDYKAALLCARLSREVYGDFLDIKFASSPVAKVTLFESDDQGITDTQVALLYEPELDQVHIVFRGSDKDIDWFNNFQLRQKVYPYGDEESTQVRFHRGIMSAYFSVRDRLLEAVRNTATSKLIVTGHSLGGALSTVAALDIQYNITQHTQQPLEAYSFGSPRVGNDALVESFQRRVPLNYRFVYGWDLVTQIPRVWQGYVHVEQEEKLGPWFTWNIFSRQLRDHEIVRYIAALEEKVASAA